MITGLTKAKLAKCCSRYAITDFDGDDERAGHVLGRPAREIREMLSGDVDIDDDLAVKECGIAEELGIAI